MYRLGLAGLALALLVGCGSGVMLSTAGAQTSPPAAAPASPAAAPSTPEQPKATDAKPVDTKPADTQSSGTQPSGTKAVAPAATPNVPAEHPATATTPAIPAPGSQPSTVKPGDSVAPASDASAAAGPQKPVAGTGSSLLPHDLSPYGMFMNADIVVKAVMIGLIFASFVTWTILIAKSVEILAAKTRARRALTQLAEAHSLAEAVAQLQSPKAPVTRLAQAALAEEDRSRGLSTDGVKDRAAALLSRIEARAGRSMTKGTGILATIGSTSPFVGLFGTVWGIMNSFIGISKTNTTNLAVVAPGIAEALLATACGLVAAIPAVIVYNMFARSISGYRSLLNDASAEVLRLLSRDLDRASGRDGLVPMGRRAAAE